jgi:DNA-binding NarL/FixJ family response regulator
VATHEVRSANEGEKKVNKVTQPEEFEFQISRAVWVNCPYPAVTLELERILEAKTYVYSGQKPPVDQAPSLIIFCPEGEEVDSEVRQLQALVPDAPILVVGLHVDTKLAQRALLAGAAGFIHLGMPPSQIACALSAAFEDKTIVPRDLLEALLTEMVSHVDLIPTPHQREFLELVATAATSREEIVVPRELLEIFLREAIAA